MSIQTISSPAAGQVTLPGDGPTPAREAEQNCDCSAVITGPASRASTLPGEPGRVTVALAWCLFHAFAVAAVVGAKWVWLRRRMGAAWWWLTYSVDCAMCKKRMRQCWIPLRKVSREYPVPRVSHGYCPECGAALRAQYDAMGLRD